MNYDISLNDVALADIYLEHEQTTKSFVFRSQRASTQLAPASITQGVGVSFPNITLPALGSSTGMFSRETQDLEIRRIQLRFALRQTLTVGDDSGELQPPTAVVVSLGEKLLEILFQNDVLPTRVVDLAEGGLSVILDREKERTFVELYNGGEIGYLIEDTQNKRIVANKDVNSLDELLGELTEHKYIKV